MAKLNYYLDIRHLLKNGTSAIKLIVRNHNTTAHMSMSIYVKPEQWDAESQKLKDYPRHKYLEHPDKKRINDHLARVMVDVSSFVNSLPPLMAAPDIKKAIIEYLNKDIIDNERARKKNDELNKRKFIYVFNKFNDTHKSKRTHEIYKNTCDVILAFDKSAKELNFEDITVHWLKDFEVFCNEKGNSINTISLHFRNIRAVFNYARDVLEITHAYPFGKKKYTIKTVATAKRYLTKNQLQYLFNHDFYSSRDPRISGYIRKYIDLFKLSLFLCGIRPIDLAHLKKEYIVGDRIEFNSKKTGKFHSVKVEPEAMEIIKRYPGKNGWLIQTENNINNYRDYFDEASRMLKNLRDEEGNQLYPRISYYWARHSWATLAAELDIPMETVSACLGHMVGMEVTLIYVAFNRNKADEANRRIIDYVLGLEAKGSIPSGIEP